MYTLDFQTGLITDSPSDVQSSTVPRAIVGDEPAWRVPNGDSVLALSASKVVATRWYASSGWAQEFDAETPADATSSRSYCETQIFGLRWAAGRCRMVPPHLAQSTSPAPPSLFVACFGGRTMCCIFTYPTI